MEKKNFWSRYGLYIGICVAAVVIICAVVLISSRSHRKEEESTEAVFGGIVVNNDSESFTYDFSVVGLQKDAYPEINELAEKYLEALRTGDVDTLNKIIQSETKLTEGTVNATGDYIEAYQDITCYTMEGLENNTYVVYVVFDEMLVGINTPAPSMIRLYVCRDSASGGVYIFNGSLTGELKTYMEMADSNEDVSILKSQVNQAFLKACEEDEELAEVYNRLQRSMSGETADSTAEDAGETSAMQDASETEAPESETAGTETEATE